jgi:N-acetylglucosaminyl-diphospho-decaprenol L-rhamnosyltransferase
MAPSSSPSSPSSEPRAASAGPMRSPARRHARRPHGRPRLSVVIVNYRQWEATDVLVRQLLDSEAMRRGDAEIVIVDNHSPRHPATARLRRTPGVSVRRWNSNHGFARAVNEGCRLSRGDWFLVLNPDLTLADDFLDRVLATADGLTDADPRRGIVGFHLRNSDGSQQLSTGPVPSLAATLGRLALPRRQRKYHAVSACVPVRVPWVTGCCMLVRRACLEELGGLDEQFFLYYEDVDLCVRARARGWTTWYDPTLGAVHHHPLHSRARPAALRLVTRHSLLTFARKNWPAWQTRLLTRVVGLEARVFRWLAGCRSDAQESAVFVELEGLARDLLADDTDAARVRLERVIRGIDLRVGV